MLETMLSSLIALAFVLLAATPLVCLVLLARHFAAGTALPAYALPAIYFGCLLWIPIIAFRAAIGPSWRPWVGAPIFVGLVLGSVWSRRAEPAVAGAFSGGVLFALMGFMGWVALGGGYFDRAAQVPHAAKMLKLKGVSAEDAAALAGALRDEDVWVRWGAVLALRNLGPGAAPGLDALVDATADPDPRVSREAWGALRRLGDAAAPAAPAVAALLQTQPGGYEARHFFQELGPKAKDGAPALVALLADPSPDVRVAALNCLAYIGPAAKDGALPALARLYRQERDERVKNAATDANGRLKIGSGEWQQALSAAPH